MLFHPRFAKIMVQTFGVCLSDHPSVHSPSCKMCFLRKRHRDNNAKVCNKGMKNISRILKLCFIVSAELLSSRGRPSIVRRR